MKQMIKYTLAIAAMLLVSLGAVAEKTATVAYQKDVTVTATDANADPSGVTTYTIPADVAADKYDYEITANFHTRISIATATITVEGEYPYTGSAIEPTLKVEVNGTELTKNTDYTAAYENNINARAASANDAPTIKLTGKGKYIGDNSTTFTIDKAAATIGYDAQEVVKTLADAAFTNQLTNTGDGTVSYESSNAEIAAVNASSGEVTIKDVGEVTITATVTDGANYTYADKTASYMLRVENREMEVSVEGYTGRYDGQAHGISITVKTPEDATIKYGTQEGTYDLDASPTYTNAGSYTVYYQITKDKYKTVTGSASVVIERAEAELAWTGKYYGATGHLWWGPEFSEPQQPQEIIYNNQVGYHRPGR